MKIYPTLNIQQGRVVSTSGRDGVCPLSPLDLATSMLDHGATHLALVDVDAALGKGNNRDTLAQILRRCQKLDRPVTVQVAGGIRSSDQAQFFIDLGANWLVAGTILHKSPMAAEQLMARFHAHLTAAIDARGGTVHRSGWVDTTGMSAQALAQRAKEYGFRRLLFVDIPETPDAAPDFETAGALATACGLPLVMGGSLTSTAHLEAATLRKDLKGVLVDATLFPAEPGLMAFLLPTCA